MILWRQTIRTGNVAADEQMVVNARAHAIQQGLALLVQPLPGGGFEVQAVPPDSPYAQPPGGYPPSAQAPGAFPPAGAMQVAGPAPMGFPVAGQTPMMASAGRCQTCGRHAPTKQVTFMQNIGCLVIRFPKTLRGNLCRLCISKFFWQYTTITFFFGWWGVISFFYTLVSIPQNIAQFLGARSLPREF